MTSVSGQRVPTSTRWELVGDGVLDLTAQTLDGIRRHRRVPIAREQWAQVYAAITADRLWTREPCRPSTVSHPARSHLSLRVGPPGPGQVSLDFSCEERGAMGRVFEALRQLELAADGGERVEPDFDWKNSGY